MSRLLCRMLQDTGSHSDAPNLVKVPLPAYTKGDVVRALVEKHWLPGAGGCVRGC